MNKIYILFLLFFAVQFTFGQNGCNGSTPEWGERLGEVSFKTNRTWIVGNQEWSDVVMATACQKESFDGGYGSPTPSIPANFNADCCSNSDYGDLFSWCAVVRFQNQLCPNDWRVPTWEDFQKLDIALGGTGYETLSDTSFINNKYLNDSIWGGTLGGYRSNFIGSAVENLQYQGIRAFYWSQSDFLDNGFGLRFYSDDGSISPQGSTWKDNGRLLRCVRCKSNQNK